MVRTFMIDARDGNYDYKIYLKKGFLSFRPYVSEMMFRKEGDKEWAYMDKKGYEFLGCYIGKTDSKGGYIEGRYPEKLMSRIRKDVVWEIRRGGRIVFRVRGGITLGYIVEYVRYSELKQGEFERVLEEGERKKKSVPVFEPVYKF